MDQGLWVPDQPVLWFILHLYGAGAINAAMLFFGFFALRMLGQSSLSLVCNTAINLWWVRRRGAIMGLSGLIVGIGGLGIFPNLIQALIAYKDWRFAYLILGVLILLVFFQQQQSFFVIVRRTMGCSLTE